MRFPGSTASASAAATKRILQNALGYKESIFFNMKISCIALQLIASAQFSTGFSPLLQQATVQSLQQQSTRKSNPLFSTQWDEEDDDIVAAASFEDAGQSLKDEDDKKKMGEMGDFDSNPAVSEIRSLRFGTMVFLIYCLISL